MHSEETGSRARFWVVVCGLAALLLLLTGLNLALGGVRAAPVDTLRALLGQGGDATLANVVWKIRLPRMAAAALLGGALALSGFLLQTFFNNPIAGPYVLGVSSGAKLAVALVMVLLLGAKKAVGSAGLIAAAFVGATCAMGFVLLLSQRVRHVSALIVVGVMIGYICSAVTDLIVTFADDASIANLHNWSRGSFSGVSWNDTLVMGAVTLACAVAIWLLAKPIRAYQLGEAYARSVGVPVRAFRVALVLLSSLLSACVTAFAGPVSFVGIAAPHLVRALLRTSRPMRVIPTCFLGGAVFCLGCDLLARTAFSPLELSISSVTALFGAPVVIAVMRKKRMGD